MINIILHNDDFQEYLFSEEDKLLIISACTKEPNVEEGFYNLGIGNNIETISKLSLTGLSSLLNIIYEAGFEAGCPNKIYKQFTSCK